MGTTASREEVRKNYDILIQSARKHAEAMGRPINILFMGEPGTGKSSSMNNFLSALLGKPIRLAHSSGSVGRDVALSRTTNFYKSYTLPEMADGGKCPFRFFDCPGMKATSAQHVIKEIMDGLDQTEFIFEEGSDKPTYTAVPNASKKIDYVIWVIDSLEVTTPNTQAWWWSKASRNVSYETTQTRDQVMKSIFNKIFKISKEEIFPFIVFTKIDQLNGLDPDRLTKEAFTWCPIYDKHCLVNPVDDTIPQIQSEITILNILSEISNNVIARRTDRELDP